MDRHARQRAVAQIGERGQARIAAAHVSVLGLGASGSAIAETLARAGVGTLRLIDRDVVEPHNLQRQRLYDDACARAGRPKAAAAAERLAAIDPALRLEVHVTDVVAANVRALIAQTDLVFDGTDNFETRLLLNDAALEAGTPWIYTGVLGCVGHTLTIVPGRGPCFRCYVPELPAPGSVETCESAGVLGPAVDAIAAFAVTEGLKWITGRHEALRAGLLVLDLWAGRVRTIALERDPACPACVQRRFEFLAAGSHRVAEPLCGRDAVHLRATASRALDLAALARRLERAGAQRVVERDRVLRFAAEGLEVTLFADGRAIVRGSADPARARSLYARWIGT